MDEKKGYDLFWILVAVIIAVIATTYILNTYPILYKGPWACVRYVEMSFLYLFSGLLSTEYNSFLVDSLRSLDTKEWSTLSTSGMAYVDKRLMYSVDILFLAALFVFLVIKSRRPKYRRHLNLDQLINEFAETYRFLGFINKVNPIHSAIVSKIDSVSSKSIKTIDMSKGPWGLRKKVYNYCVEVNAVHKFKNHVYLDSDALDKALTGQLGRYYKGLSELKFYERWLVACWLPKLHASKLGDEHSKYHDELIGDVSFYFAGDLPYEYVEKKCSASIEKYKNIPAFKNTESKHAFVITVLRELFHLTKEKGIHPAFHYNGWLFEQDRTLALTLLETGPPDKRSTNKHNDDITNSIEISPFESAIECLYPRLLWFEERMIGRPIYEPDLSYIIPSIEEILIKTSDFRPENQVKAMKSQIDGALSGLVKD